MPRNSALTPSDLSGKYLHIVCEPCAKRGRYAVERLIAEHGDVKLTDLLTALASCPKTKARASMTVARRGSRRASPRRLRPSPSRFALTAANASTTPPGAFTGAQIDVRRSGVGRGLQAHSPGQAWYGPFGPVAVQMIVATRLMGCRRGLLGRRWRVGRRGERRRSGRQGMRDRHSDLRNGLICEADCESSGG